MGVGLMTMALTLVTILVASIVHGIAGFGLAKVAMGIIPLFR